MKAPRVPRGLRNHNPGNLRLSPGVSPPGFVGPDKDGFAVFSQREYGLDSLARLLVNYGSAGFNTIAKITGRYAPPKENDTGAYANYLAKRLETTTDAPIDMTCTENIADLMEGIVFFENGRQPYHRTMVYNSARKAVEGRKKK